jgi:hypothetical protein
LAKIKNPLFVIEKDRCARQPEKKAGETGSGKFMENHRRWFRRTQVGRCPPPRQDDSETDLIYSLECKTLGIEIATAFYHNQQAEIESQLALGKFKSILFGAPRAVTNDQGKVIVSFARWELDDKCAQRYAGHEVWLCIELQAPRLKIAEAAQLADAISIPARHNFARIYFGFHALPDGKGFTVLRRF